MSSHASDTKSGISDRLEDESKILETTVDGLDAIHERVSRGEIPELGVPVNQEIGIWRRLREPKPSSDAIATQPSVFDDPAGLRAYAPPPQYENTHRFDPLARWTWREENALVRKVDFRIMIWTAFMFSCLELDRSNITQANTDNFLVDLGMTTDDYNLGQALFKLCFLCAELPSQLIAKRVGPEKWLPSQMVLWSAVALSQFWLTGRPSFLATRCLLGVLQGGFIPDTVLYLSYFYNKSELAIRLAFYWAALYCADIIGALLATALLQLDGVGGHAGWRYLFLVEGALTFLVGLASYALMPTGPTQTKRWSSPKGWFTEREEIIMVNRILRDDPSKSDMHNRQPLSLHMIWSALKDWGLWPLYVLGIMHMIPVGPPQAYLTLSLRNLGFTTTQSTLLSIPATFLGMCNLLATSFLSELIKCRTLAAITLPIWALPLLCVLYTFNENTSQWAYFAVVTLIVGFPYVHPIQVAWTSRNSYSVRTRTISASLYNMTVQAGAIAYSYIYRTDDAPLYKRGNRILIIICCINIFLYIGTFFFYRIINQRRDRIWNAMTPEQRKEYLETTKDEGNKRLDFRFGY
ncbi:MFS general substrate transporter [Fistulina hepatica ATCC 64428]|uniref:MFS general substrate transporter n=1 Tax=Fistulina hepatica ATCC 64428 TaxID=1128425 RepID=A0A0D7AIF9_9AGAR|nr:MFS general substrate transporter [Fistulina hepatica ATCC 64428]